MDRMIAGLAGLAFLLSCAITLWFFLGFVETDPELWAASSALLLSLLLGVFAILPSALICRIAWAAWRGGFHPFHGLWTLFLTSPWIVFGIVSLQSDWLPISLSLGPLLLAGPILLWALTSLLLELRRPGMRS